MNSTIAKLADEFEKMEKTIASQKKMIETLMSESVGLWLLGAQSRSEQSRSAVRCDCGSKRCQLSH